MRRTFAMAGMLLVAGLPARAAADQPAPVGPGPQIGFAEQAAGGDAARGLLSGEIADFNGVESFWVAVRASRRTRTGWCRWWSPRLGRLPSKGTACQAPEWIPAQIRRTDTGFAWKARLGGHPPHGHYIVVFRAVDGSGNVQRSLPDGRSRVGIDVSR
jgi:hypothetical protein